jgi:hypothetical protein
VWSCIAVKKSSVSANKSGLSTIFSKLLCLHIFGWVHTGGGHARLFGTIVCWLCYYILHLRGVHLHLRGLSPAVCNYHVLLLLQHEETMWPVCLRIMSEGASPVYHVVELHKSILCHPFAVAESFLYYYYYYYYYYYTIWMSLSQAFSSRYFSWTSGDPHRSRFKLHTAVLSVLCVMFQV